jgi:hypothetical protein
LKSKARRWSACWRTNWREERAGERESALEQLRAALADDLALAEKAARDSEFDALRGSPGFPLCGVTRRRHQCDQDAV